MVQGCRARREGTRVGRHPLLPSLPTSPAAGIGTIVTALIRSRIIFRRLQTYIVSGAQPVLPATTFELGGNPRAEQGSRLHACLWHPALLWHGFTQPCLLGPQVYRMASSICILVSRLGAG